MVDDSIWAKAPERFLLGSDYHDVAAVIGWDRAIDLGMFVWETRRPPSRRRATRGGRLCGILYVPQTLISDSMKRVSEVIGEESARRIVQAFGGQYLEFSKIEHAFARSRNKAITEQVMAGHRIDVVAWSFDLTDRQVRRIVRKETASNVF